MIDVLNVLDDLDPDLREYLRVMNGDDEKSKLLLDPSRIDVDDKALSLIDRFEESRAAFYLLGPQAVMDSLDSYVEIALDPDEERRTKKRDRVFSEMRTALKISM